MKKFQSLGLWLCLLLIGTGLINGCGTTTEVTTAAKLPQTRAEWLDQLNHPREAGCAKTVPSVNQGISTYLVSAGKYLVLVECNTLAYQSTYYAYAYNIDSETATQLKRPSYRLSDNGTYEETLTDDFGGFAEFTPDNELVVFTKYAGHGQCGDRAEYIWSTSDETFITQLYKANFDCNTPLSESDWPDILKTTATITIKTDELTFIPDPGFRLADASNPGVKMTADGKLQLLYEDHSNTPGQSRQQVVETDTTSDWMDFNTTNAAEADPGVFRALKLSDGSCRTYGLDATKGLEKNLSGLKSKTASDCLNFVEDSGSRYDLQPDDNGTMGVYELFVDSTDGVVLLYIGDKFGDNSVRRAYSTDNGYTFSFTNDNVFGDADQSTGPTYVDEKVIELPDGRFRAITMRQGSIYTFISEDDGKTFALEDGVRLAPSDFTEFNFAMFNDPQLIELPDGRFRIYTTAYEKNPAGGIPDETSTPYIVSATTAL